MQALQRLHTAHRCRNVLTTQAVQLLLSRCADPKAPDDIGLVPFTLAEVACGPIREALLQAVAQAGLSVEEIERQAFERAAAIDLAVRDGSCVGG